MESTIVIKVKYGETLRRFNARVNEAGQLDLDMSRLREKVLGLFNFAPDADLTLTYIDEDGDVVTFVDEEDLHDVMRQSLNPLRICVKLNAEKGGRSYTRSSGSSTPMRSPRVQLPLPNLNSSVSEFLKSVPEPVREALSKLSLDLASKAASSTPVLVELVDSFSRMGQSYINPLSEFQAATETSTQSGASGSAMGAPMTKVPEASKDDGATSEVMQNAKFEEPAYKTNQKVDLEKGTRGVEASATPTSGPIGRNASLLVDSFLSGCVPVNPASVASRDADCGSKGEVNKLEECPSGKTDGFRWVNFKSVESNFPASDNKEARKSNEPWKSDCSGFYASTADSMRHSTMDFKNTNLGGTASTMFPNLNLINECPFSGIPVASDSAVPSMHLGSRVPPFKRGYNHNEGMGSIFHRGVCCDGCGVHPITGPRFKSKVKDDYDLCSICFSEMGNDADYIRMDHPVSFRHPHSFKGLYDPMQHHRMRPPTLHHVLRGGGMKPSRPKLDSRFIMDVNVVDGTIMAPSTSFTKIWRMRNNGNVVWPQGTQLLWIGGDKLSNALSVEVQISSDGLPVDNELEVAVDFTTPDLPGRYTSYWRMASPSGQKFGQRVWVLIQVDASLRDSLHDSFHGLNLNLPPDSSGITGPEMVNMQFEPVAEVSLPVPYNSNRAKDLVEPIVYSPTKVVELNFPINDTLLVGGGALNPVDPEAPATVSYPVIDLSEVAPALPSLAPSPSADVEQTLLKELEEMGFKQIDLNKEILRMNEYDLGQSVDDLCGVAEWDPILEELEEMGFGDKEMNMRLLKKNNGSIKRVVMDLIAGEKV